MGFARSLGSSAGFKASGTAAIISTSRGLPCSLCFLETVFRRVLRLIASWLSCALASMDTISEHVLMSASFWDGAPILPGRLLRFLVAASGWADLRELCLY